jgi:hypothetical protein
MEWQIAINEEHKFVDVITSGIADKDSSLNMANDIINIMQANQLVKVLIDHSNLASVKGDAFDVYERPQSLKDGGAKSGIKIAEVVKAEHLEHFKFFETVCRNQGLQMSIFQNKEKALSWLLQ